MEECVLHEDVLVEIFCFLPKKSLARFKCVCKRWHGLISDSNRVFPKTTHVGFVCQNVIRPLYYRYPDDDIEAIEQQGKTMNFFHVDREGGACLTRSHLSNIEENCLLHSSCNGFLLLVREGRRKGLEDEDYLVYHPATKRSWHLIPPVIRDCIHLGLASDAPHHFNLVRIFSVLGESSIATDVYSSRDESWREDPWPPACDIPRYDAGILERGNSVFLRGALHWVWRSYLLIYQLKDGVCEILKLPRVSNNGRRRTIRNHCIWDSEGCVNYCFVSSKGRIGIWTLCSGNWNSKCSKRSSRWKVKHKGILAAPFVEAGHLNSLSPIAFNDEFAIVYLSHGRKIFSYNPATGVIKEACRSPFEGIEDRALWVSFPFSYLTQFDISDMVRGDGELSNPGSDEMLKRRKLL